MLTVDVEEWFHDPEHPVGKDPALWAGLEATLPKTLQETLELMDRLRVRATFFVLGWAAERYPNLVRDIASAEHEVACHGWNHQRVDRMCRQCFSAEVRRAKALLEQISGRKVVGFRAPRWSFGNESWPYEVLSKEGFLYSSSCLPIPGLGKASWEGSSPCGVREFPALTGSLAGFSLPAGGTVALRIMPETWLRKARDECMAKGRPAVYWFHPWELLTDGPKLDGGRFFKWARYRHLEAVPQRLESLVPPGDRRMARLVETPDGE
jgi:polysaccharide deacetylase family protein (PEP-CTERM system associated)